MLMNDRVSQTRARTFTPKTLAVLLALPVATLLIINLTLGLLLFTGVDRESGIIQFLRFFDFNDEGTVANWYNSLLLGFVCWQAAHAWLQCDRTQRGCRAGWIGLAIVFFYMSMDEALGVHESSSEALREYFNTGGLFYWAWVIPGLVATLVLALVFAPFVLRLPSRTRNLIFLAGFIYVAGAIGCEMIGGFFFERDGASVISDLASITEEVLEMSALILMIFAVQEYRLSDGDAAT